MTGVRVRSNQMRHLRAGLRECLVVIAFLAMTAVMTWPWVTSLSDAVADNGDPYMIAWTLWWDYHQTFNDPLSLFHANVFFPYRYTLAFSEHDYGIALIFFPLFAAGLRPLTVHSIATFVGFAFCGYGAFRLARTLTGSNGAAWVAGVVFAFIPYRFLLLVHLHYLFAGWIPLLLEALVLFVRVRSRRRAAWLGVAFLFNGLTCITWLVLTLVPLALSAALLVVRHRINWERAFWLRGAVALVSASLLLMPFLWPYYAVNRLYKLEWNIDEVARNSASLVEWLTVTAHNRVWNGMGNNLPGVKTTLFTGLLAPLLALGALLLGRRTNNNPSPRSEVNTNKRPAKRWLYVLDAVCIIAGCMAVAAAGFGGTTEQTPAMRFFRWVKADDALLILTGALIARLCILYRRRLVDFLRSERRDDTLWLGLIWTIAGFLGSFGPAFFLYRALYEYLVPFRSIRAPQRAAMICYVGLALLAGLGARKLTESVANWRATWKPWLAYSLIVGALLFELHAAPVTFMHGALSPDAVTLQLKQTPMRGGVVELPSLPQPPYYSWHLSMLRAADHGRPIVSGATSFIPPLTFQVHEMTKGPGIAPEFLDLLEKIPASYVIVRRRLVAPERQHEFATFFANGVNTGRLRLVGTYDGADDLYVVTKTEPRAPP